MKGKLIIFSAPSGAGKTTIVKQILKQMPELEFSISATSRNPRKEEEAGKDYYFLTVDEFKKKITNNEFIEWEEVYEGIYYGTLNSELERIWQQGKHVVFDIDVLGGINLKNQFDEAALSIFVEPPSLQELENRLRNRSTDSEESIKKRISKAVFELDYARKFDKVIVNNILEDAVQEIIRIVKEFIKKRNDKC